MPHVTDIATEPPCELQWFACHAKPRCEKRLAAALAAEGREHYLPLVESVRRYGARTKQFTKPLFPGYLFARLNPGVSLRADQLAHLVRTLPVVNEPQFLGQLDAIRRLLASGHPLALHPLLEKGRRVRIIGGPLWGLEGRIDDPLKPKGIVLAVDILQQGVHVTVAPEFLRVIE